jgi:hypothetical protein
MRPDIFSKIDAPIIFFWINHSAAGESGLTFGKFACRHRIVASSGRLAGDGPRFKKLGRRISRENQTKVRSKYIDLHQCRKTTPHASPRPALLETSKWRQTKKPSVARKDPEWHQCRCYQWSSRLTLQCETSEAVAQTSSRRLSYGMRRLNSRRTGRSYRWLLYIGRAQAGYSRCRAHRAAALASGAI